MNQATGSCAFGSALAIDGDTFVTGSLRRAKGLPASATCPDREVENTYVYRTPDGGYFFPTVLSVSGDRVAMTNGNPVMPQPQDVGSVSVYGPAH